MIRRPPRSTRTDTLFPSTTLFRSWAASAAGAEVDFADETPNSLWTISTSANAPSLAIRYRAPLDSEAAALLADAVLRAIAGLLANRDGALNGIDIVDPAQLDRQLHDWNDTARPRSLRDTVQGRFEEMRHRSPDALAVVRSEEHTSELQSLMRISYAVFCLKKKPNTTHIHNHSP